MKMKVVSRPGRLLALLLLLAALAAPLARAQSIVTNRYDMEPVSSYVTEVGWTHITWNSSYSGNTTAGFDLVLSQLYNLNIDRGSSTQTPTSVTRDFIMGNANANTNGVPIMVFRDIAPAYATNVTYTIFRSDPGDTYPAAFTTKVRFAGGSEVTVDTGHGSFATYHPVIAGTYSFSPVSTNTSFEYIFYAQNYGGSTIRINGIESIYAVAVPEPAVAAILMLPLGAWLLARRRSAKA
jgi:hypothetical protein